MPFLLLPFRLTSDTSAARNFIRNFFKAAFDRSAQYTGEGLQQELRLTEPLVSLGSTKRMDISWTSS